jgi:hypothetical protein
LMNGSSARRRIPSKSAPSAKIFVRSLSSITGL